MSNSLSQVYRAETHQLSVASEAGPGGYLDNATGTNSGTGAGTLTNAQSPGDRTLTLSSTANYSAGNYIQVDTGSIAEVRKILRVQSTTLLYLDYPISFPHAAAAACKSVAAAFSGTTYVTFVPGAWDAITVPDMTPEFIPHWFLGTASNRNWYLAYKGRQQFAGTINDIILLNGYPLRFPIGSVTTTGSSPGASTTLSAATLKGALSITVASGLSMTNSSFIQIESGTTAEVRQIVSGGGTATLVLNYPLMLAHANAGTVQIVSSPFTHTVRETQLMDSMTWHLRNRDSAGASANDFIRRWLGGKVNRATLSATEGDVLKYGLDEVQFLDLVHNQQFHSLVGAGATEITKFNGAVIDPATGAVGAAYGASAGALTNPTYPTTNPYYFSQGVITFFGVTLARIRNFTLDINNNIDPRYYLNDLAGSRGPFELQEMRREYRMTADIALPDSIAANATTRNIFKELVLEGDYASAMNGFDISLTFTRGTNDTLTITIPPAAATTGGDAEGCFFLRAPTPIGAESPIQVSAEILVRSLQIQVVDGLATYP